MISYINIQIQPLEMLPDPCGGGDCLPYLPPAHGASSQARTQIICLFPNIELKSVLMVVCCRSLCSLVCKWLYEADKSKRGWNAQFLSEIGLGDLAADGFRKIGLKNRRQFTFILICLICKITITVEVSVFQWFFKLHCYYRIGINLKNDSNLNVTHKNSVLSIVFISAMCVILQS